MTVCKRYHIITISIWKNSLLVYDLLPLDARRRWQTGTHLCTVAVADPVTSQLTSSFTEDAADYDDCSDDCSASKRTTLQSLDPRKILLVNRAIICTPTYCMQKKVQTGVLTHNSISQEIKFAEPSRTAS